MKIHSILIGLLIAFLSGPSLAQWQWLGKDGRKVYSDRAPGPDIPEKNILKRPSGQSKPAGTEAAGEPASAAGANNSPAPSPNTNAPANAAAKPPLSPLDKELEVKKKQAEEAEAAKKKQAEEAFAKAKIENCARAKQSMATLNSGVRMSRANAAGETEIMDDAARAAEAKKIQAVINSDCK